MFGSPVPGVGGLTTSALWLLAERAVSVKRLVRLDDVNVVAVGDHARVPALAD